MHIDAKKVRKHGNIVHHVPGRVRIKILGSQASSNFFADVKQAISSLVGVDAVRVNSHSSSIVVHYRSPDADFKSRLQEDPKVNTWLKLESTLDADNLIEPTFPLDSMYLEQHSRIAESIVSVAEQLDCGLLQASNGYLDFKVLLPLGIAIATSLNRARGRGTPMWISLGTFAFNSFLTFHHRRINTPRNKISAYRKNKQ